MYSEHGYFGHFCIKIEQATEDCAANSGVETTSSSSGIQSHFLGQMILTMNTDSGLMHQADGIIYMEPPPRSAL